VTAESQGSSATIAADMETGQVFLSHTATSDTFLPARYSQSGVRERTFNVPRFDRFGAWTHFSSSKPTPRMFAYDQQRKWLYVVDSGKDGDPTSGRAPQIWKYNQSSSEPMASNRMAKRQGTYVFFEEERFQACVDSKIPHTDTLTPGNIRVDPATGTLFYVNPTKLFGLFFEFVGTRRSVDQLLSCQLFTRRPQHSTTARIASGTGLVMRRFAREEIRANCSVPLEFPSATPGSCSSTTTETTASRSAFQL